MGDNYRMFSPFDFFNEQNRMGKDDDQVIIYSDLSNYGMLVMNCLQGEIFVVS